jgi:hypothetical protein
MAKLFTRPQHSYAYPTSQAPRVVTLTGLGSTSILPLPGAPEPLGSYVKLGSHDAMHGCGCGCAGKPGGCGGGVGVGDATSGTDWTTYALVGGAAYLLWKMFGK